MKAPRSTAAALGRLLARAAAKRTEMKGEGLGPRRTQAARIRQPTPYSPKANANWPGGAEQEEGPRGAGRPLRVGGRRPRGHMSPSIRTRVARSRAARPLPPARPRCTARHRPRHTAHWGSATPHRPRAGRAAGAELLEPNCGDPGPASSLRDPP